MDVSKEIVKALREARDHPETVKTIDMKDEFAELCDEIQDLQIQVNLLVQGFGEMRREIMEVLNKENKND